MTAAIPVVWLREPRLCWDQEMVHRLLHGALWQMPYRFAHHVAKTAPVIDSGIVVVPARYCSPSEVNDEIAGWDWAIVILTSDEESTFDHSELSHPAMRLWVQTPRPGRDYGDARLFGYGFPPDTPEMLAAAPADKTIEWCFAGQVTHRRRQECIAALSVTPGDGVLLKTAGFTQGIERRDYLAAMAKAKVAPCPSGPATHDSFRLWEALEAGCLPIADSLTPDGRDGYWEMLIGDDAPFPLIGDWSTWPMVLTDVLAGYPANANRAGAWWQQTKRAMATDLIDDIELASAAGSDDLTVLVTTSPIPSHPSTAIIEETVASVRDQLGDCEIVIVCDGVRKEQEDRRGDYEEYLRRLLNLCRREWTNVVPFIFDRHLHQANAVREVLSEIRTPLLLFVEHDTPLHGEIDWPGLRSVMQSGGADVIRLHHEAAVLDEHRYLMIDDTPVDVEGVPLLRTLQWSQRPHLTRTSLYRELLTRFFPPSSRTMIEDVMHGVVQDEGWERWRLWMYAPPGDMKRSLHLDGRGADPKFEMVIA